MKSTRRIARRNFRSKPRNIRGFLKAFVDLLLFSSIFMGMQGMGMIYTSSLIQGIAPTPAVLAIMMLVPLSVYNMNRKTDEEEDSVNHPGRYKFTKRFGKPLEYGAFVAYAIAVLIAVPFGLGAVLVTLVPLIAGILYSVPLLPPRFGYRRLKEIPVMKNLVVGSSWAIILVLLPCCVAGVPITLQTLLCVVLFFSYVFIASAMPDMRDREGDAMAGVITIPVLIGIDRTKRVLNAMNLTTAFMVIAVGIGAALSRPAHGPLRRNAVLHPVLHQFIRPDRLARPDLRYLPGWRVRDHRWSGSSHAGDNASVRLIGAMKVHRAGEPSLHR